MYVSAAGPSRLAPGADRLGVLLSRVRDETRFARLPLMAHRAGSGPAESARSGGVRGRTTPAASRGPVLSRSAQRRRPSITPPAARSVSSVVGLAVLASTSKSIRRSAASAARPPAT